ncbi:MAG: hypothetical protein LAO18_23250 [Acidobacteriia bacterium]|nr:hypothetical protein [Terriglobia bacterium]
MTRIQTAVIRVTDGRDDDYVPNGTKWDEQGISVPPRLSLQRNSSNSPGIHAARLPWLSALLRIFDLL